MNKEIIKKLQDILSDIEELPRHGWDYKYEKISKAWAGNYINWNDVREIIEKEIEQLE